MNDNEDLIKRTLEDIANGPYADNREAF